MNYDETGGLCEVCRNYSTTTRRRYLEGPSTCDYCHSTRLRRELEERETPKETEQ